MRVHLRLYNIHHLFPMSKIQQRLEKIKKENRLGLMTHIVVGYPSLEESKKLVQVMDEVGVDFIELQIPFSDPMADGPTIMQANQVALENGTRVRDSFQLMSELSAETSSALIFMTYFNIVHHYGVERFCHDAAEAGASGLIVPDAPLDYEDQICFLKYARQYGLVPIPLLSPASTTGRIKKNAEVAEGFVYFVSRKGVTGVQTVLDPGLLEHLQELGKYFSIPIAVGFGMSQKEHIQSLKGYADIVVVGSAVLQRYEQAPKGQGVTAVREFLSELLLWIKG
jgi:tryptophan synthase alpha subunit